MTTIKEMGEMEMHSDEWFKAAFESCPARKFAINASTRICKAYGIKGQVDPAYIASIINNDFAYQNTHGIINKD